jgi:hypothetical protein
MGCSACDKARAFLARVVPYALVRKKKEARPSVGPDDWNRDLQIGTTEPRPLTKAAQASLTASLRNKNVIKLRCTKCPWTARVPIIDLLNGHRLKCPNKSESKDCGWTADNRAWEKAIAKLQQDLQAARNEADNNRALANVPRET